MNRNISLEYLDSYNIENVQQVFEKSFSALNLHTLFKPKMKVLVKVSLPYACSQDMAESTNPAVVSAVVNTLNKLGVKCIVADSPYKAYTLNNLDKVYLNTGMLEVANTTTCELNRDLSTCVVENPNGMMLKSVSMINIINEVDAIVNIGKIKIDNTLGYIGAVSNLFGLIPGEEKTIALNRLKTLKDFYNFNLDLYETVKDKLLFNVLDGVVAKEAGDTQRMLSCLAVGENAFCLDASVVDILGIKFTNTILKQARDRNYFDFSKPYKQISTNLEKFKVEDFALVEFDENTLIHNNENKRKKEYKSLQKRPYISKNICKGCSICSKICPTQAITMKYDKNGELYAVIDYDKCILCYKCITACPYKVANIIKPQGYTKVEKQKNKFID